MLSKLNNKKIEVSGRPWYTQDDEGNFFEHDSKQCECAILDKVIITSDTDTRALL